MENNLPKGWAEVELSFLVEYKKGKKPKRMENKPFDNSLVYLDIRAIEKKNDEIFVDAETSNATDEDELVIVWDGARAGWVGKSRKGALGSTLMGLKPKIARDYLYRFIQTQFDYLQTNHRGTGIPHVDPDIFWNIKVPLAPEKEQQRIVAKLDELMEKIDLSRARLERIPKILKRFRQSILSAAVSGKLTEEWREKNVSATVMTKVLSDDLPITWGRMQVRDLATSDRGSIQSGPFGSNLLHSEFQDEGILAIGIDNVLDGKFSIGNENRISLKKYEELKKYTARPLDVLITVMATVGRCCVIPRDMETAIITKHVYRISCNQQTVNPYFLLHCLRSSIVEEQIQNKIQGVTRPGINGSILKDLLIPIPSIREQTEILRIIDHLFGLVDRIETRYTNAKVQIDKLPQSLLAKAFRGELAPQDENDEPAGMLLARINDKPALRSVKKSKTNDYQIVPPASINGIAAESKFKYAKSVTVRIPENKRAFAKQVLGGKIVSLFKDDPHFTHIKFQKLQYLAEHLAEVDLNWNYYRQSAGPYDPKFMHTVAFKLKASKWFEEKKYKFHPLEKADKIEGYYEGYFKPASTKLDSLFSALKPSTEDEAEIVATLYAVWNNMIINKEKIVDEIILSTFFEWSDRKKKYSMKQVTKLLEWMRKNSFIPNGFGKIIKERSQ